MFMRLIFDQTWPIFWEIHFSEKIVFQTQIVFYSRKWSISAVKWPFSIKIDPKLKDLVDFQSKKGHFDRKMVNLDRQK